VPEPSIVALLAIGLGMAALGYTSIAFERLKNVAHITAKELI
jgi:hypothetical protein